MRLGFVDEEEGQKAFAPFLARGGEDFAHHALAFAHPHIEDLRPLDVHEVLAHLLPGLLLELLGEIVGGGLADERLAAAGRAVEQEALGRGMLKALEEIRVEQRQLDRIADGGERFLLAADFFPRQLGHGVEVVLVAVRAGEDFDGDLVVRIDAHFVADLELLLEQQIAALQDERLHAVLGADAEPVMAEHLGDLHHRPRLVDSRDRRR